MLNSRTSGLVTYWYSCRVRTGTVPFSSHYVPFDWMQRHPSTQTLANAWWGWSKGPVLACFLVDARKRHSKLQPRPLLSGHLLPPQGSLGQQPRSCWRHDASWPLCLCQRRSDPARRRSALGWLQGAILQSPPFFVCFTNLLPSLPQDARFIIWLSSLGTKVWLAGLIEQLLDETDPPCENINFPVIWRRRRIYPADVLVCNRLCLPDWK